MEDLRAGKAVSRRYRNRRIGEFLKELDLTEGRSTGIPKILKAMKANGSPAPVFESDEDRTHFLIRLPVHTRAAAPGEILDPSGAESRAQSGAQSEQIMRALRASPRSMSELADALGLRTRTGSLKRAVRGLLDGGLVEYTLPDKRSSRLQKYRLTPKGLAVLDQGNRRGSHE